MTLTLQLTEAQEKKLRAKASQSGKDLAAYLLDAAGIEEEGRSESGKRQHAMEFSAIAPTRRTAAEIDASRMEWES